MRIKYITEDGLLFLKNNKTVIYREIFKNNGKLVEVIKDTSWIKETQYEIGDMMLVSDMSSGHDTVSDSENVQRVYNHMKALTDSQASDERVWVAYTLMEQLEYMKQRWPVENDEDMLNRYFFNYSIQRSLFRNGMSRLWWIGRVTYDASRTDPYELTKFICRDQDFIETICGRNIFNNKAVMNATITAIYDSEKNGIHLSRELIRGTGKYVNLLAGTYIIDAVNPEIIYDKVCLYIKNFKDE
ncbi:MAG: hypothetical protein K6E47_17205 [Lachnospiraceae bacterium]|nr:hypothetical protein [Lachnospiraceae bacterium]